MAGLGSFCILQCGPALAATASQLVTSRGSDCYSVLKSLPARPYPIWLSSLSSLIPDAETGPKMLLLQRREQCHPMAGNLGRVERPTRPPPAAAPSSSPLPHLPPTVSVHPPPPSSCSVQPTAADHLTIVHPLSLFSNRQASIDAKMRRLDEMLLRCWPECGWVFSACRYGVSVSV